MNVASLEICKKLYEVSGWKTGRVIRDNPTESSYNETNVIAYEYDIGYLLRKLRSGAGVIKNSSYYTARPPTMLGSPENNDPLHGRTGWDADTPENALCIMAIELFEKGILTQEATNNAEAD